MNDGGRSSIQSPILSNLPPARSTLSPPFTLIPWQRLEDRIGPHYFRSERGRRPYPLALMLRVHIVQLCYNLSDPAMEDLLYEAESVRRFAGLRLSEPIPDEAPSSIFVTCWSDMNWARDCLRKSKATWKTRESG